MYTIIFGEYAVVTFTFGFYYLRKASVNVEVVYVCSLAQTRSQCHNLNPPTHHHMCVFCVSVPIYRLLNAIVAQSKNCPIWG
jgi:hypothetical protein